MTPHERTRAKQDATAKFRSELGERLRLVREAAGLPGRELARRAGLGEATVGAIERGENDPTASTLCAIVTALGCDGHWLLLGRQHRLTDRPSDRSEENPGDGVELAIRRARQVSSLAHHGATSRPLTPAAAIRRPARRPPRSR